jgi:putative endopeptidase
MRLRQLLFAAVLALPTAYPSAHATSQNATPERLNSAPALGTFGIDTTLMDRSVKPGEDFYRYVNGKWLDTTAIPDDKSRFGSFVVLRDQSEADVRVLLGELVETPPTDPTLKKVADLYVTWMDKETLEKRGIAPLQPDLDRIAAIKTPTDLMTLLGDINMSGPIGFGIQPDPADTSRYIVFIGQAGLGMGRDYYSNEGPEYDAYRRAYRDYIGEILTLLGNTDAEASAKAILELETKLASVHWSPAQRRDVKATYNPMNRDELKKLAPQVDWPVVLAASGLRETHNFVVAETTAISGGAALLDTVPLDTWKKYLAFHRTSDAANLLPRAFDQANFEFYSKTIRGIEEQRDRWKRGVSLVDRNIGEGLGQAYVAKYFPPGHKAKMDELVQNLLAAMKIRIEKLTWMDEATRAEALKKLSTFDPRIGYPSKWRDYSKLTIEPGKLFESIHNARAFEWRRRVDRLDQPVDRDEWFMTPPTVNAYYDPLKNQITFPAAILQPPFFDAMADPAVNYGAIGGVIGHEIGHGFDDQGREFDEKGSIRNWWTDETEKNFEAATRLLSAQYSAYCPIEGDDKTCVNGELTMGENIGDLGGLEMAYAAYRLSLNGEEAPVIDGFTGDQRFFMAWAQVWRGKSRTDALRNLLLTDPHSPEMIRGQVPQRNIDAWYKAFGVVEGDKMYLPPDKRVRIW